MSVVSTFAVAETDIELLKEKLRGPYTIKFSSMSGMMNDGMSYQTLIDVPPGFAEIIRKKLTELDIPFREGVF